MTHRTIATTTAALLTLALGWAWSGCCNSEYGCAGVGEPCSSELTCAPGLGCLENGTEGTCQELPDACEGDPCACDQLCPGGMIIECAESRGSDADDHGWWGVTCSGGDGPSGSTVVGAWYAQTPNVEVGWTLCEDHRLYGFTEVEGYSFLDKGTWSGTTEISVVWTSKDTVLGDVWDAESATLLFDRTADTLCCMDGAPMERLAGAVTNSDCDPAW